MTLGVGENRIRIIARESPALELLTGESNTRGYAK